MKKDLATPKIHGTINILILACTTSDALLESNFLQLLKPGFPKIGHLHFLSVSMKKYIAKVMPKNLYSEPKQHKFYIHFISFLPIHCCILLFFFSHVFSYTNLPMPQRYSYLIFIRLQWKIYLDSFKEYLIRHLTVMNFDITLMSLWHQTQHIHFHIVCPKMCLASTPQTSLTNRAVLEEDPIDCKGLQGWPVNWGERSLSSHSRYCEPLIN